MSIEKAYDKWAEQYDTNKNRTRDLDKVATWQILNDISPKRILELGCGTGKNTEWLISKAEQILAVDFSGKMLELARKKISNTAVRFLRADITQNWTWSEGNYNLLTCNLILEHIKDLDFIFRQAYSNLNSEGYFFISELHPFKQYAGIKARFDSPQGKIELETFTHHVSEYTQAALNAGFVIKRLDEWFDHDQKDIPRLISFLFQKK